MSDSKTIAALEIGTGKMQVFIGEIVDGKTLNFIGSGQAATEGVKKADIIDVRRAAAQAQAAIVMAERSTGASIKSVCLGISGTHIKGFRNIGSASVSGADAIVREEDVERAKDDARSKILTEGKSYIHRICCGYYVDDEFTLSPVGKTASRIDAEYWMMYGDSDKLSDAIHVVQSFGLEVEYLVFSALASAIAVTNAEQKNNGVLVVDIGCGTSDYVLYKHGRPMQAGVIPIGGDHITNDLSYGIRLSRANSERIKRHCGKATITEDEKSEKFRSFRDIIRHCFQDIAVLTVFKQIGDKKISMDAINKVIRARLEELFLLLRDELNDFMGNDSIKEVVLTGGTSNLIGICELASAVLGIPCSQGKFDSSVRPNLRHQEFATALGLLEYAREQEANKQSSNSSIFDTFAKIFKR